jgi:hypothetical protein
VITTQSIGQHEQLKDTRDNQAAAFSLDNGGICFAWINRLIRRSGYSGE